MDYQLNNADKNELDDLSYLEIQLNKLISELIKEGILIS